MARAPRGVTFIIDGEVQPPSSPLLSYNIVIEFPHENPYRIEETTIELENGPPHYTKVLLKSELISEKSQVFQWFRSAVSTSYTSRDPKIVTTMCNAFAQYRNCLSIPLKEYILMDAIVSTCYRLQVEDSSIVCKALEIVYSCWQTLGPLHFRGILRPDKFNKEELEKRKKLNLKTKDYLSFFLHHATTQKLKFDGHRMVDVSIYSSLFKAPIVVAADVWSSKAVLRYLQHGARFEDLAIDATRSRSGLASGLVDTLRLMIQYLYFRVVHPALDARLNKSTVREYCRNLDVEAKELCMTVTYILRAIKLIEPKSLKFTFECFTRTEGLQEVDSLTVLSNTVVQAMIPTLKDRYENTPSLKHNCRWIIRNRLNQNYELPYGVKMLGLPRPLRRYLNLLAD